MSDTWRNQNGRPWLQVDDLVIQFQFSFSLENEIGLCDRL